MLAKPSPIAFAGWTLVNGAISAKSDNDWTFRSSLKLEAMNAKPFASVAGLHLLNIDLKKHKIFYVQRQRAEVREFANVPL